MNISLKLEHEQFIQSQIQSGRYTNADEVVDETFRLLERKYRLESLRNEIAVGNEQVADGEIAIAKLRKKTHNLSEQG